MLPLSQAMTIAEIIFSGLLVSIGWPIALCYSLITVELGRLYHITVLVAVTD